MAVNTSGFSSFPGNFSSDQIVYTSANSALKYSVVANGQNVRGTTGGAVLGVSTEQAQSNNKLFNVKYNWPFLGQRNLTTGNIPQLNQSTVNGITKGVSAGNFSAMIRGQYIVLGLKSQVAGVTTGVLSTIMTFPAGHYNVVGQNLSNKYRNTWLIRISGGWYYQTGQPVNAQYSRDNFGTDKEGTGPSPGRITYNATGNPGLNMITNKDYNARYGS